MMLDPIIHPLTGLGGVQPVFPREISASVLVGTNDYLSRTFAEDWSGPWTFRALLKFAASGAVSILEAAQDASNRTRLYRGSGGNLVIDSETGGAVSYQLASAGLFVDQTGWYDVCLSYSDAGYMRMHVNGALVGELDTSAHVSYVGKAVEHRIGSGGDCYVAGVHFAQEVLAPTAFGDFSTQVSGLWVPRR